MEFGRINCLLKISLLFGVTFCYNLAKAQPSFLHVDDSLSHSTMIFHANFGYGVSPSKSGESIWTGVDNTKNTGITYTLRWTQCSDKRVIAYGLYIFGYNDSKKILLPDTPLFSEKTQISYVAPQLSFIKKETLFTDVFGLLDVGMGYLHYKSDTEIPSNETFRAQYNGIGFNVDIGCEYAFARNWGAKLEIGGLFSPIRVDSNSEKQLPLQPRKKINLALFFMQIGISTYL